MLHNKKGSCSDLVLCSRCFELIGKTKALQPAWRCCTKKNEMQRSTGQPFVTTSTTAAAGYCGCVKDEDWSFVNLQIGFQVLSLITMWFYWWETTYCFPSNYLTGQNFSFIAHHFFFQKDLRVANTKAHNSPHLTVHHPFKVLLKQSI